MLVFIVVSQATFARARWLSFEHRPFRPIASDLKEVKFEKPELDQVADYSGARTVGTIAVVSIPLSPILAIALIPASASMTSTASELRYNYFCKEFRTTTLSPGEKARGFLYFHLDDMKNMPDKMFLNVEAMDLNDHNWMEYNLPIAWKQERKR